MLGSQSDKIKQELEKKRNQQIRKSAKLKKLILKPDSGWSTYYDIVSGYIDACKKRKAITALDRATPQAIEELRLVDHEIYILEWALAIPAKFIEGLEKQMAKDKEKEQSNEQAY